MYMKKYTPVLFIFIFGLFIFNLNVTQVFAQTENVYVITVLPVDGHPGTAITIYGTNFTPTGNTLHFVNITGGASGPEYTFPNLTSSSNGEIDIINFQVSNILIPGNTYSINVSNSNGNSVDASAGNARFRVLLTGEAPSLGFYPLPVSASSPTVLCTNCPGINLGLKIFPYSSPIKRFVGRFIDSNNFARFQQPWRTLEASYTKINLARDRVYMRLGSTFAAYNLSTFFTSKLNQGLQQFPVKYTVSIGQIPGPGYLPWDAHNYPEEGAQCNEFGRGACTSSISGWQTHVVDGQDRMFGFDYDDRGYIYVTTVVWGWGILEDNGGADLRLVSQVYNDDDAPTTSIGAVITSVKASDGRYYAILSGDGSNLNKFGVWDVTDPSSPRQVRVVNREGISSAATAPSASGDIVAVLTNTGKIQIYTAEALVSGGGAIKEFKSTSTSSIYNPKIYTGLTTDGTNFYTTGYNLDDKEDLNEMIISVFSPATAGQASSYVETRYGMNFLISNFSAQGLRYGAGYLTTLGTGSNQYDIKLFRLVNKVPQEINLNGYFNKYYWAPPAGYARPGSFVNMLSDALVVEHGGKLYLILSTGGLGDVYELDFTSPTTPPGPIVPPDTGCKPGDLFNATTGQPCTTITPPGSCILSSRLRIGSSGDDVRVLQTKLNLQGANLLVDGAFGPLTQQAVIDFQKDNGLVPDGIVGPITTAAVGIIYCEPGSVKTYPVYTPTPILSGPNVSPVAVTVAGPTSLNIGQEGTWTVTATDANNDNLSWSVDWGEGRSVEICLINPPAGTGQNWTFNLSHSWATAGTYRVAVYINDCKGGIATEKSFLVAVGGSGGGTQIPNSSSTPSY